MPKKHIIIFGVLCVVALGLGYWSGPFKKDSENRAEADTPPVPTIITNVVKEVVTNIVAVAPQPTPTPAPVKPRPTPPNIVTANAMNPIIEAYIRKKLKKPTGELTKADLEKVTVLYLGSNQLTSVQGLEKLTQLKYLHLSKNQLTDVKGLEFINLSLGEVGVGFEIQ